MSLSFFLEQSVTIERPTVTQDASAGSKRTWSPVAGCTNTPCNIQPIANNVREALAQRQIYATHTLWFDEVLPLKRGDRCRDDDTGDFYVIEGFRNIAGQDRVFLVDVKQQT